MFPFKQVVPKGPPYITNVPSEFGLGQWVNLNCSSEPSRPPARLMWIMNGQEVKIPFFIQLRYHTIQYFFMPSYIE